MHIAAASPAPLYVTKDEVPAEVLEKEKEIYRRRPRPRASPRTCVDKIAEGKLKEYYATFCLLEQPFVREPKLTVGQLVQEKIAIIKENIVVRRFARFRVGEEAAAAPAHRAVAAFGPSPAPRRGRASTDSGGPMPGTAKKAPSTSASCSSSRARPCSATKTFGIDRDFTDYLASEIKEVHDLGVEIAAVVGRRQHLPRRVRQRRTAWTASPPTTWACWPP